tara:strand:+ start:491 stop:706 length:216 start_codon:yes stop_codon:yes gene_type:complete
VGDLVNFPTWIFEKERELDDKERELTVERYHIEREKYQLRIEKATTKTKILVAFSIGLIAGISLVMIISLI